ncbi:MAG TPA: aromatic ring-hydroxylating dioxygenase subunit alpha, partial [Opitutaceae bacterium]|nr:aromatic ring-hydroxylating dioxygenase subunit alpha [Opitutaceae bacterium]
VLKHDWFVVARSHELVSGRLQSRCVLSVDVVLWRSDSGVRCWEDLCIHRGVKLSAGSVCDNKVRCGYHGWTYDSEGRCTHIPAHPELTPPARARTRSFSVFESAGLVWMNFDPVTPEPSLIPEIADLSFRKVASGPFRIAAAGPRLIENFLDIAHLPIVHDGYLGTLQRAEIGEYSVEEGPYGLLARDIRMFQPNPDGLSQASEVSYDYGVVRPLTVYLYKDLPEKRFALMYFVTPLNESESMAYFITCMNYGHEIPDTEIDDFAGVIIRQDIPIVESQRPERLPLDLQAELHLRSDRLAIAYRQWLRKLGLSFGTA